MRYLPLTPEDRTDMLGVIGVSSIDALFADVPEAARLDGPVNLPRRATELEVERAFARMLAKRRIDSEIGRERKEMISIGVTIR